jgi:hypothetical protein
MPNTFAEPSEDWIQSSFWRANRVSGASVGGETSALDIEIQFAPSLWELCFAHLSPGHLHRDPDLDLRLWFKPPTIVFDIETATPLRASISPRFPSSY